LVLFRRLWMHLTSRLLYKMVVTPLIVIISLFYFRSTDIIETKIKETTNQTLVETADKIDGILKLFEQKADNISLSLFTSRLLKNEYDPDLYAMSSEERMLYTAQLKELLNEEVSANEMIDAIYIFDNNGKMYASEGAVTVESYWALTYVAHEIPGQLRWAFFTDHQRLLSAMEIKNDITEKKIGMISIALNPQKVFEAYSSYPYGSFFIANSGNLILSAHNDSLIGTRMKLVGEDKNTIVHKRTSLYSGFTYYSNIPKKLLNKEIDDLAAIQERMRTPATVTPLMIKLLAM
jgi:two-component system sensor histidine kinase YesM